MMLLWLMTFQGKKLCHQTDLLSHPRLVGVDPQKKIVSIAQNTVPFSEAHVPSNDPAMYVVEVLAGYCIRHNINVGDIVTF